MRTTIDGMRSFSPSWLPFLDREHTIARPGYSRWMVPPAALCVHLCIGQAYAFSVFNLPMNRLLGISQSVAGDWKLTDLGWIFSLASATYAIAVRNAEGSRIFEIARLSAEMSRLR